MKILKLLLAFALICMVPFSPSFGYELKSLEKNIAELWLNGPSQNIEKSLELASKSKNAIIASKALFHLACLKVMQDKNANVSELVNQLEALANSETDKKLALRLKNLLSKKKTSSFSTGLLRKVTLDMNEISVIKLLKAISKQGNFNIVIHKNVSGAPVSMKLTDVTVKEALDAVCQAADLYYEKKNNLYVIMSGTKRNPTVSYNREEVKLSWLSSLEAKKLVERSKDLVKNVFISTSGEKAIVIDGEAHRINAVKAFIKEKDKELKAFLISIKIWELNQGIEISGDSFCKKKDDEKQKIAKLLSAPKMVALPRNKATIKVESSDPYEEGVNYNLKIFFDVIPENKIHLKLEAYIYGKLTQNKKLISFKKDFSSQLILKQNIWTSYSIATEPRTHLVELKVSPHSK